MQQKQRYFQNGAPILPTMQLNLWISDSSFTDLDVLWI